MNDMIYDCPICGASGCLEVTTKTDNIPYFGEILESTLICKECGYRHSDTICVEPKDPVRYSMTINSSKLNSRVIKSQSTTITIPEFGLKVEPGPKSQGFVSNVEGVLERFEKAVMTALSWAEEEEIKKNAVAILESLEDLKNGSGEATLIIEDPFGHSAILDPDAEKRALTTEEIDNLKTGFTTIDNEEKK